MISPLLTKKKRSYRICHALFFQINNAYDL